MGTAVTSDSSPPVEAEGPSGQASTPDASPGGGQWSLQEVQTLHRKLLHDVREAICDSQRQFSKEWTERLQQLQQQQLDSYLQSADQLLRQQLPGLSSLSAQRGHREPSMGATSTGRDVNLVSPQRRRPLRLPMAGRSSSWTEDCMARSRSQGPLASKSSMDLISEASMGMDSGEVYRDVVSAVSLRSVSVSPTPSRRVGIEEPAEQEESDLRSEENEKYRDQWQHHLKASLTKRLGTMSVKTGLIPHKVSGMLGINDAHRRRVIIVPRNVPRSRLEEIVDSKTFHAFCGLTIVVNSICIGIQTDFSVKNAAMEPPLADPHWFHVCNFVFNILFAAELLARMVAKRWRFLFGSDWKWNVFDTAIVLFSICEELLEGFSLTYTRLLRVFRMVHVLKVIRVMRFFRELRLMVCSIVQSLVSLSWALLLLLLVMYLFTICFMHAVSIHLHEGGHDNIKPEMVKWYGSVGHTMFSLLLAVSGGEDWVLLVEPLAHVSVLYQVLFSFYILFVVIGVLNVLTSAFVQRACELSRLDRDLVIQSEMISDEAFLAEMKSIFEEVDGDGTGKITWQKFRQYLQNEDVQAYFATQQLDTSDARELFNLLDLDKNEEVSLEEFIMGCKRLRGQARSADVASLLQENKRAGSKHLRQLRKMEAQIRSLNRRLQGVESQPSFFRSPTNASSYPQTPASAV